MQHSVSNSEWITINMVCSRPLQPHYNPITYGIFITNLEKKWGGIFTYPCKKGGNWPGGGGYLPGGGSLPTSAHLYMRSNISKLKTVLHICFFLAKESHCGEAFKEECCLHCINKQDVYKTLDTDLLIDDG